MTLVWRPGFQWWDPSLITTALWLDAADANTITESSGEVSQWNDKSGNGRNATQATQANRPALTTAAQNSLNAVSFDGSNDFFSLASALPLANSGSFDVFMAGKPTHTSRDTNHGAGVVRQFPGSDAAGSWGTVIKHTGAAGVVHLGGGGSGHVFGGSILSGTNAIASWTFKQSGGSDSAAKWTIRIDAGSPVAETNASASSGWGTGNGEIGRIFTTSGYYYLGLMYEIVITVSEASTTNRQRIEGYLAHKWGLTANLPSDHPYKTNAPAP
jgi:hypothetical protein